MLLLLHWEQGAAKAPKCIYQSESRLALFAAAPRRMLSRGDAGGIRPVPNSDAGGEVSNPANKPLSASIGEAGDLIEGRLFEAPSM